MSVKDIADQKISIPLGDGRTLVAYPGPDGKGYKEIWIDIIEADDTVVPVLVAGYDAGDLNKCHIWIWGKYGVDDYTDAHEILRNVENGGKHEDGDKDES